MIRNGRDLRRARLQLGMTMGELGEALRLSGDVNDRINKLEREREIPGPTAVAVEAMLAGYRPGWSDEDAAKRRPPEGFNPALKGKPNAIPR